MNWSSFTCFRKDGSPKTEYASESSAQFAAEEIRCKRGQTMHALKCDTCLKWHVSPVLPVMRTECKPCGKMRYKTREEAIEMARRLYEQDGINLRVYKCPHRKGWHLTKKKPWKR